MTNQCKYCQSDKQPRLSNTKNGSTYRKAGFSDTEKRHRGRPSKYGFPINITP